MHKSPFIPASYKVSVNLVGKNGEETSKGQGTVQVSYRGQTGVICDNGWDKSGADVVCKMLGFE